MVKPVHKHPHNRCVVSMCSAGPIAEVSALLGACCWTIGFPKARKISGKWRTEIPWFHVFYEISMDSQTNKRWFSWFIGFLTFLVCFFPRLDPCKLQRCPHLQATAPELVWRAEGQWWVATIPEHVQANKPSCWCTAWNGGHFDVSSYCWKQEMLVAQWLCGNRWEMEAMFWFA